MFLGEGEVDVACPGLQACLLDSLREGSRTAEVRADRRFQLRRATWEVLSCLDGLPHPPVNRLPIRATEHGTGAQKSQRIIFSSSVVDGDVPKHVFTDLLCKIYVDAQEVRVSLSSLNLLEQRLEPTKGRRITTNPEKLDALQASHIAFPLTVPDVLQDRGKWCDTDTSSDKNRNLAIEDILGRCTIRTINTNYGQGAVRCCGVKLNEVTTNANKRILILLLGALHRSLRQSCDHRRARTQALSKTMSPVTDLTNMDRHVWILWSGSDCERMPLEFRDLWHLNKQPLASGVFEAWLNDPQFHRTAGVNENFL